MSESQETAEHPFQAVVDGRDPFGLTIANALKALLEKIAALEKEVKASKTTKPEAKK